MTTKKQGLIQPKTQSNPLQTPVKVIFDHQEELPVPFVDIANVQGRQGVILITFGRVVIPTDLTIQEIGQRAARQGIHAAVVARVALTPVTASQLIDVLVNISKQVQAHENTQQIASTQSGASIQSSVSKEEQNDDNV